MPNYKQKNTATKGNMAAQQKEKKKKYTSQENSDGTTTNTFEKKRKLGKNKGQVKKRVTSIVKKDKSGETKGLASVTQKYDKKGKLKSEKGSGKKKELASLRKSVKNNDSIAAAQQGGRVKSNLMKQNFKRNASKNKSSSTEPTQTTTVLAETGGGDKFNTGFKMGHINPNSKSTATQIPNPGFDNLTVAKAPNDFKLERINTSYAANMKGHPGKMSDTDMGIKERYGKQATSDVLAAQQKGNPIMPNLYKDEYTDSGMNYRDANNASIKGTTVDEGHLSNVKTKSPYRPYVETEQTSKVPMRPNSAALPGGGEPGEKLFLDKAAKMHAHHPSKKRMSDMVTKVATYNMPNVKAAQKKYYK